MSTKRTRQTTLDMYNAKKPRKTKGQWSERMGKKCIDLLCWKDEDAVDSKAVPYKIAAFDLDDTVITTKSGAKFATGAKDWKFLYPSIPEKLTSLNETHLLVIISNQKGVKTGKLKVSDLKARVEDVIEELGLPMLALFSTDDNVYRKPWTGMWEYLSSVLLNCKEIDLSASFYVGDAAGRPANWAPGKKKDFSCSDRKFAENVRIGFKTPEELFLGENACTSYEYGTTKPSCYLNCPGNGEAVSEPTEGQEMILMVGPPGSGKSSYAERHFSNPKYVVVNRDNLKTIPACLKAAAEALQKGKSVVIDNTNPSEKSRKEFIDLAKHKGVRVHCVVMDTPLELCRHLNNLRFLCGKAEKVPGVAYNIYKSAFAEPDKEKERIYSVTHVPFKPCFKSDSEREQFLLWTE